MLPALRKLFLIPLLASTLALGGCFFGDSVEVSRGEENPDLLSLSVNGFFIGCNPIPLLELFSCNFSDGERDSSFGASVLEFLLFLFLVDPVVIQLPDGVSIASGTFSHPATASSLLTVDGPLNSVAIDRNRSLTAEAGTSLYVVSFPDDVLDDVTSSSDGVVLNPDPATVGFNLQLTVSTSDPSFSAKAIIAAHARTLAGDDFYPPVFPCVTSMADVPELTVPVPAPGGGAALDLSAAASVQGCSGEIFDFGMTGTGGGADGVQAIPLFGFWGLASLAALLSTLAFWRIRRRGR